MSFSHKWNQLPVHRRCVCKYILKGHTLLRCQSLSLSKPATVAVLLQARNQPHCLFSKPYCLKTRVGSDCLSLTEGPSVVIFLISFSFLLKLPRVIMYMTDWMHSAICQSSCLPKMCLINWSRWAHFMFLNRKPGTLHTREYREAVYNHNKRVGLMISGLPNFLQGNFAAYNFSDPGEH